MLGNKKRIYIIGTVGVPACYGGFESLVDNLLDYTPVDVEYTVFCSAKKYERQLETYKGAKLVYLDRDANGKDSIFYDYESMKIAVRERADIMLILGVSGCMFLPKIRRAFKGKIITNIDGLEWKRDKWKFYAKWLLHWSERQAVKSSDVIIGDNKGITDYVHSTYKNIVEKKRVELIAYGGDQVTRVKDDSLYEKYPFCRKPYAVTVCRIEPENNVHVILEAFAKMVADPAGTYPVQCFKKNTGTNAPLPDATQSLNDHALQLVIVGNWEKSDYGRVLKQKYADMPNIHLLDPIYEPHTINWIRSNAHAYIHGHSAGGTNPSLVEAMNLGLPILAFDCVYNRATTEEKCLYWKTSSDIILTLEQNKKEKTGCNEDSDKDSQSLAKIGERMLETGVRLYSWKIIAEQYNVLY